jgi:hypothetical protein
MTINWQDVIVTVFTTVGGGGILLGSAAYLIKTALTHRLKQEAETFKAQLKASSDAEIERLKNSLQMTALEHQVRFSKLHEKRAEVIAELYKRLVEASDAVQSFVLASGGATEEVQNELYANADKSLRELVPFFEIHRIYIPIPVGVMLDEFGTTLSQTALEIKMYGGMKFPSDEREQMDIFNAFNTAYQSVQKSIPEIKEQLENEFRVILGEV